MTVRIITSLIVLFTAAAVGQTEFIVNTRQDSTQRDPQIERDAAGNVVVVWSSTNQASDSSLGDIVMKRFAGDVSGPDQLVNTVSAGTRRNPRWDEWEGNFCRFMDIDDER